MAKTKRGTPPLFELLDANRWRRKDAAAQRELRVVHHAAQEDVAHPNETEPRFKLADDTLVKNEKPAVMQFLGDRLHLSLTPLTAAVGVFVILLVMLGA